MLNAYHRFRVASMVGVVLNVVTIAGRRLLNTGSASSRSSRGRRSGCSLRWRSNCRRSSPSASTGSSMDLHHPGLKQIWELLGPIIVGSAAGQIALFFDRFFASTLSPGYMAGMNYATKLVYFPQQVFGAAIATVIFPLFGGAVRARQPPRRRPHAGHGPSLGQFHHDPGDVRLDRARASDGRRRCFSAGVPGQRDRPYRRSDALRRGRTRRARRQHRVDRCCFACHETARRWPSRSSRSCST